MYQVQQLLCVDYCCCCTILLSAVTSLWYKCFYSKIDRTPKWWMPHMQRAKATWRDGLALPSMSGRRTANMATRSGVFWLPNVPPARLRSPFDHRTMRSCAKTSLHRSLPKSCTLRAEAASFSTGRHRQTKYHAVASCLTLEGNRAMHHKQLICAGREEESGSRKVVEPQTIEVRGFQLVLEALFSRSIFPTGPSLRSFVFSTIHLFPSRGSQF